VKRPVFRADRGHILMLDLEPTLGSEQRGRRPVFVVTRRIFNDHGLALVCPITTVGASARWGGFAVNLGGSGLATTGVVLCNQPRTVDLSVRKAKFVEQAPPEIVAEVIDAVGALLE